MNHSSADGRVPLDVALRESESNFRTFFESMTDMIIVGTLEGRVLYVNAAFTRTMGYSVGELATMHILDMHPLDKRREAEETFAAMFRGERQSCPLPLVRKDGVLVPVETRAWLGQWDGLNCIFGICKNLTEEQETHQRFERLFRNNPSLMALSTLSDRRFSDVNDAFLKTLGYSRADIIGKNALELGLFVYPEKQIALAKDLELKQCIRDVEMQIRCKDGTVLDGLFYGELISSQGRQYFLTVMIDITERKRVAETLRQSEERFRSFIENANDIIYMLDPEGIFTYISTNCKAIIGYDVREIMGQSFATIVHPDDVLGCRAFLDRIITTGEKAVGLEYRIKHRDGTWRWHASNGSPMGEVEGKWTGYMGISRDISAKKQAEEYEEMGREIHQILDGAGELKELIGRVLAVLKIRTGCDAVGIRLQEGDDYPYCAQQGFPEDFLLTENSLIARAADGSACRDKEGNVTLECTCGLVMSGNLVLGHPLLTKGGSFWTNDLSRLLDLPVDQDPRFRPRNQCIHYGYASVALSPIRSQNKVLGLIHLNDRRKDCFTLETMALLEGIASHIGAAIMRKRTEVALRESEEKFSRAFQTAPQAILITRALDGKFVEVNDAFTSMMGFTREETLACTTIGLGLWGKEGDRQRVLSALSTGQPVTGQEYPFRIKSGEMITGLYSAQNFQLGQVSCILSSISDITVSKRNEAELQKMQNLQSVGTLAGGIAHDFNNILMGVFGYISLAKDELAREHPGYTPLPLAEAEQSLNRAVRLTSQLLTFAKGGAPVKEEISLGALVEDVAQFDLSGSNVMLIFQQAGNLWSAEVDKGQMQQAISNITLNARQAMPDGGHLYITLENAVLQEGVVPGLLQGNYVKVTMRDEGSGIDPEHIRRIFDPYFTTLQPGRGLGLAAVYSIIKKHGGHIGVVSELGKGTTFTIYLPASAFPRCNETTSAVANFPPPVHSARILVMDDDLAIRNVIVQMLTRCGFSVATAACGKEALEMYQQAQEAGTPYDVVVMDLTVPGGMGGREAVKRLLAMDPGARAIVSSGYADDPVMANYADYGFKGIVTKPYTRARLLDILGRVLN
ncbi:MAG: PAS domain S-box protein [bacterium]